MQELRHPSQTKQQNIPYKSLISALTSFLHLRLNMYKNILGKGEMHFGNLDNSWNINVDDLQRPWGTFGNKE